MAIRKLRVNTTTAVVLINSIVIIVEFNFNFGSKFHRELRLLVRYILVDIS